MSKKETKEEPQSLNYFGPFAGDAGYASAAREYVSALSQIGVDLAVIPDDNPRRPEDRAVIQSLMKPAEEIDQLATSLSHSVPRGWELCQMHGERRFSYSVLETDKIPDDWVKNLNLLDGAMTASKWGKEVYEKCGVENVSVVPHGVDALKFSPFQPISDDMKKSGKFIFFSAGKFEPRKGYDLSLKAFAEVFGESDDAMMVTLMSNPFVRGFHPAQALLSLDLPTCKNIVCLPPLTPEQLSSVYATIDCFVLPTRGEGWGLPITEAMASKKPVIVTNHSGPTEYLTKDNSYPLGVKELVDVPDTEMFYHFLKGSKWAEPDYDELKELMQFVKDNPDDAAKKGERARKDMQEKYSWKQAAEKMTGVMF